MTVYYVGDNEFLSVKEAKAYLRKIHQKGTKTKAYANACGEIKLNGSNRCRIV